MRMLAGLAAVAFAIVACSPQPTTPRFAGNNNSGILTGDPVGKNGRKLFPLQKRVTVTSVGAATKLNVVDGFLFRSQDDSETGYYAIRVKNIDSNAYCFIKASQVEWINPVGAVLKTSTFHYLRGSVGQLTSVATDTCLASGETGVLAGIEVSTGSATSYYSPVSELKVTWEEPDTRTFKSPEARLLPQSYTSTSAGDLVTVAFSNQGSGKDTFTTSLFGFALALNSASEPTAWFYLDSSLTPDAGVVVPSGVGSVSGRVGSDILSNSLWVFLDFEDCSSCLTGQPIGAREQVQRARLDARDDAQRRKQLEATR